MEVRSQVQIKFEFMSQYTVVIIGQHKEKWHFCACITNLKPTIMKTATRRTETESVQFLESAKHDWCESRRQVTSHDVKTFFVSF